MEEAGYWIQGFLVSFPVQRKVGVILGGKICHMRKPSQRDFHLIHKKVYLKYKGKKIISSSDNTSWKQYKVQKNEGDALISVLAELVSTKIIKTQRETLKKD